MTKLAVPIAAAAFMAGAAVVAPMPAAAQSGTLVVYGNDPCPRATDDNVVVCYRRPETERYRIAEQFRTGGTRQQRESWTNKARHVALAGRTGIQSCSPVGPAGYTGCLDQLITENQAQAREEADAQTPPEQ